MKNIDKIAEALFDKIRSRFEHISLGDAEAKDTTEPENARFFNFDYISPSKTNYGNITLSLVDENSLKVYFSKSLSDKIEPDDQPDWFNFLKTLRFFAKRNMLKFDTRDINRDNLQSRDVDQLAQTSDMHVATDKSVTESKLSGNSRTSYQEIGPVRLVVKHSGVVNDEIRGARSRKIESIFIETAEGERFRMPFKKLSASRAIAEHLSQGGQMHDPIGQHVVQMVEEMSKLSSFVRSTKNRMFEDAETQSMCEAAAERYMQLNSAIKRMGSTRGYKLYAESYIPETLTEDDVDLAALKERFMKKMFDERIEPALSYVHRAHQRRQQANENKYIQEFDDWADEITDPADQETGDDGVSDSSMYSLKELLAEPLAVGIDGADAIAALNDIIDDESLFSDLMELSITDQEGPDADARPLIQAWIENNQSPEQAQQQQQAVVPAEPAAVPTTEDIRSIKRLAGLR